MRAIGFALSVLGFSVSTGAWAAIAAGTASIVAGTVSATASNGERRVLQRGDAVYSGERINTAAGSYVRLGFLDGGSVVLRPSTEFAIVAFKFQPGLVEAVQVVPPKPAPAVEPGALPDLKIAEASPVGNQAFFRLVRGGFRAVSGLIGKVNREEFAVATPVATIGIRGTVFSSVTCDAFCAADPLVQAAVPASDAALGGTVSAVDQGSVVIVANAGQSIVVDSAQFVLTTASGAHVMLPGLPGFLSGESWLAAEQAAAPAGGSTATTPLSEYGVSTVPTIGTLAAAALIGIVVISTEQDDAGGNTATSTSATTGTR